MVVTCLRIATGACYQRGGEVGPSCFSDCQSFLPQARRMFFLFFTMLFVTNLYYCCCCCSQRRVVGFPNFSHKKRCLGEGKSCSRKEASETFRGALAVASARKVCGWHAQGFRHGELYSHGRKSLIKMGTTGCCVPLVPWRGVGGRLHPAD